MTLDSGCRDDFIYYVNSSPWKSCLVFPNLLQFSVGKLDIQTHTHTHKHDTKQRQFHSINRNSFNTGSTGYLSVKLPVHGGFYPALTSRVRPIRLKINCWHLVLLKPYGDIKCLMSSLNPDTMSIIIMVC